MAGDRTPQRRIWDAPAGEQHHQDESDTRSRWFVNHGEEPAQRDWKAARSEPREPSHSYDTYIRYSRSRPERDAHEAPSPRPSFPSRRGHAQGAGDHHEVDSRSYHSPAHPFPKAPHGKRGAPRKSLVKELTLAGVISLVFGGAAGLAVYDSTSGGHLSKSLMAITGLGTSTAEPARQAPAIQAETSIVKKPVAIARLDVSDAQGEASSLIPLSLRAESGVPNQLLALRLSGLPERAYLTAGTRINANAWMLQPGEASNVKLVVPGDAAEQFAIAVEALEPRTLDLVAPVRELKVAVSARPSQTPPPTEPAVTDTTEVQPAAAPPEEPKRNFNLPKETSQQAGATAMPIPEPLEQTSAKAGSEIDSLIDSGDKLMELGDLPAARQFYSKALELGEQKAAWKLGQTYDPAVFAEKKVVGLAPEPKLALKYYLQAQAAGVKEADTAVSAIKALAEQ